MAFERRPTRPGARPPDRRSRATERMPAARSDRPRGRGRPHPQEDVQEGGRRARRPPPKGSKNLVLAAAGVAAILLVVVVIVVSQGDKDKKTKKGGGSHAGSGVEAQPPVVLPPDITAKDEPRSREVPKLQKELKELNAAFPADLAALSNDDLTKLEADWHALVDKIRAEEYSGYTKNDKKEDLGPAQLMWQKARDEREAREKKKS